MCTVPLRPGVNPIAVNKIYHTISRKTAADTRSKMSVSHFVQRHSRTNSTKFPPSGAGNISELRWTPQVVRLREKCARRSALFCVQSGGSASVRLLT